MQRWMSVLLLITVLVVASGALAQGGNLLQDPGFEGEYTNRGRADLNVPAPWGLWYSEVPHNEMWQNLPPVAFPHPGPGPNPHGGTKAFNFNKGFATYTAAIYQQVSVPDGSNVTASAWAQLKTCNIPEGFDNCGSAVESGAYTRIGIDPNGGTNPYDSDVVWSPSALPHDRWDQMTVSATATGATVTLFLFTTQEWPAELNSVYWDDASLSIGGAGGAAAAPVNDAQGTPLATVPPPPPAEVGFVTAQTPQPDGSIVHTIQAGDTIDSIAVAYGLTRAQLLALNPLANPRIIQIGQQLILRAAPESTAEVGASSEETDGAGTPNSEATPEVTEEPATPALLPEDMPPAPIVSVASGEVLPALDPAAELASVCVFLFEDLNQNRLQEMGEDLLEGGSITLLMDDSAVDEYTTDGVTEPHCFGDLESGEYTAVAVAPDGYGLTTADQLKVRAAAGTEVTLAFGAAEGVALAALPPAASAEATADPQPPVEVTAANPLNDNLGLIVFGAAGVVLVIGMGASLALRRR